MDKWHWGGGRIRTPHGLMYYLRFPGRPSHPLSVVRRSKYGRWFLLRDPGGSTSMDFVHERERINPDKILGSFRSLRAAKVAYLITARNEGTL